MEKEISNLVKKNNIVVTSLNQLLHNEGVEFNERMNIIIHVIHSKYYHQPFTKNIPLPLKEKLLSYIDNLSIDKNEIFQKIFMFYGHKNTKINLDQYYTPFTIGKFMCDLCHDAKAVIDPACGTGDLIVNYNGTIYGWDISEEVLKVCGDNFKMHQKNFHLQHHNSIDLHNKDNGVYDYACLNPPFGSSTVITDQSILKHYELGKNKKKQEIGILFMERTIRLLKENGIAFLIVPNGYLGNSSSNTVQLREYLLSFRIIAIIELPQNTFSRSGTGVSTSLIIIQKTKKDAPYNMYMKKIDNIGYVLNKKNTPYKYKMIDGDYVLSHGKPVLDNDLEDCLCEMMDFCDQENITELKSQSGDSPAYNIVNTSELKSTILDAKQYQPSYKNVVRSMKQCKRIKDFLQKDYATDFSKENNKKYLYLDIKQITSPIYKKENLLYGHELPQRAKHMVKKYDILVSKLLGKISFTMILNDNDNLVCTNGFCVLRPKDYKSAVVLFGNLFSKEFEIQHNSQCRGSIMENIMDKALKNIFIKDDIEYKKYDNLIQALTVIQTEL